jgi:hypothetical protein
MSDQNTKLLLPKYLSHFSSPANPAQGIAQTPIPACSLYCSGELCLSKEHLLLTPRDSPYGDTVDGKWQLSWHHVAAGRVSCLGSRDPPDSSSQCRIRTEIQYTSAASFSRTHPCRICPYASGYVVQRKASQTTWWDGIAVNRQLVKTIRVVRLRRHHFLPPWPRPSAREAGRHYCPQPLSTIHNIQER